MGHKTLIMPEHSRAATPAERSGRAVKSLLLTENRVFPVHHLTNMPAFVISAKKSLLGLHQLGEYPKNWPSKHRKSQMSSSHVLGSWLVCEADFIKQAPLACRNVLFWYFSISEFQATCCNCVCPKFVTLSLRSHDDWHALFLILVWRNNHQLWFNMKSLKLTAYSNANSPDWPKYSRENASHEC